MSKISLGSMVHYNITSHKRINQNIFLLIDNHFIIILQNLEQPFLISKIMRGITINKKETINGAISLARIPSVNKVCT
jgi:hypothetical protein